MEPNIAIEAIRSLNEAKAQVDSEIQSLLKRKSGYEVSIEHFTKFLPDAQPLIPSIEDLANVASNRDTSQRSKDETDEEEDVEFPFHSDRKTQITYTLKQIGRFVKLKFLGDEVKDYLNAHDLKSETFLRTPVNAMIEEGSLISVRYNQNWKKVFYGLPEWVGTDAGGYKYIIEEFHPSKDDIGHGYTSLEFEYEPRKFNRDKSVDDDDEEDEDKQQAVSSLTGEVEDEPDPDYTSSSYDEEDDLPF